MQLKKKIKFCFEYDIYMSVLDLDMQRYQDILAESSNPAYF